MSVFGVFTLIGYLAVFTGIAMGLYFGLRIAKII